MRLPPRRRRISHSPSAIRYSLLHSGGTHATPVRPPRRLWPFLALAGALTLLLGLALRDSAASTATDRLFQSVLQPAATPSPTATRRVPGLRVTPTVTPGVLAPALVAAKRLLPLVIKAWPPTSTFTPTATATPTRTPTPIQYGWKGIGQAPAGAALGANTANNFWGLNPNWWYDWEAQTPMPASAQSLTVAQVLAQIEAGLQQDTHYVPMIWCMADVSLVSPTPAQLADLAGRYPGRVWLIFNEPDNEGECGYSIRAQAARLGLIWPRQDDGSMQAQDAWRKLGRYLADQYILYYDAIKAADNTARVFSMAVTNLPMTPDKNPWWKTGVPVWEGFVQRLKECETTCASLLTPTPAPAPRVRPIDGIAVHAYPNNASTSHSGCLGADPNSSPPPPLVQLQNAYLDYPCIPRALGYAHGFFQTYKNTQLNIDVAAMTAGQPIWITEIGTLTSVNIVPWNLTRDRLETPLVNWFATNIGKGQTYQYYNAVAWFATHSPSSDPNRDFTASNLLDHLAATATPGAQRLTTVGETWRAATCSNCECPNPACP